MNKRSKLFKGYPFAHRQPDHDVHCARIHGHNWDFQIVMAAEELDENGFVYDFGKLKWFRDWLEENFDHTLVLNEDDPSLDHIEESIGGLSNIIKIPSCSCEGLAEFVFKRLEHMLADETNYRVRLVSVTVYEDEHNTATYTEV